MDKWSYAIYGTLAFYFSSVRNRQLVEWGLNLFQVFQFYETYIKICTIKKSIWYCWYLCMF